MPARNSSSPSSSLSHPMSARRRACIAAVVGIIVACAVSQPGGWLIAALSGWDAMTLVYVAWVWRTVLRLNPEETKQLATREDPGRGAIDSLLIVASMASLLAVGFVIASSSKSGGGSEGWRVGLGVASVITSWMLVHTVFMLHYARLYYSDTPGGVDFNEDDEDPCYMDFAYLSFTIGMTFQVSDTSIESKEIRATALRQALLSYLFGTVIVATTINLVAGLAK